MRLSPLLRSVYQLDTATYNYASASRACGAIGAVKTSPRSGNSWSATSPEERGVPGGTDACPYCSHPTLLVAEPPCG